MRLAEQLVKIAKSLQLQKLIEAKRKSDDKEYSTKHKILAELLNKHPSEFKVDQILNNNFVGLTHKPTGFKIHAPRTLIPTGIEHSYTKKKVKKERVRVVIPYNGGYLLERLKNPDWPVNYGKRRHVGGGIELGEMPAQAASRELYEELGVHVDPLAFKYLGKHENQHYLQLNNHTIQPGKYKASVGSDPYIHLEHGHPSGEDYIGPDLKMFK